MAGIEKARVIDVHAHVVLAETMGTAGAHGPEISVGPDGIPRFRVCDYVLDSVRYEGSPFMDIGLRLTRMDQAGIDYQLLSPNPLTYFHHVGTADALAFCRMNNEGVAAIRQAYPDRLGGFAALPMQDIGAACEELRRGVEELSLAAGYIGTDTGRALHDAEMDRFYETCVALDVPLFLHPAPAGIDGPAGDPNLKHFDLDVVIGFAAQEAIAAASLIYGEVLDRFPTLDVCMSHGGGSTAFLIGRMARAAERRPWSPEQLRPEGAFEERFRRLWFDTHLNAPASLALLRSLIDEDHLVYGTNFVGWDAPDAAGRTPPDPNLADNARRLLRRDTRS